MSFPRICWPLLLLAATLSAVDGLPAGLTQYLREAKKAGIADAQARQNALAAGWPKDVVEAAMKSVNGEPSEPSSGGQPPAAAQQPAAAKPADAQKPAAAETAPPEKAAEAGAPAKRPDVVDRGVPDDYHIGEGDVLHIAVWKEPDASVPSVVVRPDGRISMPMLKEVSVSGMTPLEAEKMITEQLTKFISAPDVTVIVSAINSKKVYLVGGVKKEGPISYTYRMTVLQALSEAGGLTDYAKKKKIYVLRRENGRDFKLPFDYDAALRGERMELNIPLVPGDTIVVPK